ncbi:calcium-binding protein, partial [Rhizobium chutanense]|uniref:calcium-binding protein n=1 Tax=Rhizobium chutanense TaxID=2035448 RepID=UPI00117B8250
GGAGDDTYVISTGDIVIENADEGTDTVQTALAAYTLGANVENLIYSGTVAFTGVGNGLDNVLKGGVGADKLVGAGGNDTLIGGAGSDTMSGGTGDDIYVVDIATDLVIENASEGTDTVQTALASYTLGNNVENLTYTGSGNFTGTGNALANTITGGAGNDTLNGGAGTDTLIGGTGNDTYIVDDAGDSITEAAAAGTDTVRTNLASYTLAANVENLTFAGTGAFTGTGNNLDNVITGGAAIDTLSGGAGNDTLDGGAGADTLIGGADDDTYIVDNAGDSVTEAAAAGTDTVRTTLTSYTLGSDVENLTYSGTVAFTGTGNDLANTITGGAGN